jgi:hypothetical protein
MVCIVFNLIEYFLAGSFQLVIASLLHNSSHDIVTREGHPFNSSSTSPCCIDNQIFTLHNLSKVHCLSIIT